MINSGNPQKVYAKAIVNDYMNDKTYIDELIKRKIFRKKDLYENVLKSEDPKFKTVFDELKSVFKEYEKMYKQVHGKSPGAE